jgi:hypothetical protein
MADRIAHPYRKLTKRRHDQSMTSHLTSNQINYIATSKHHRPDLFVVTKHHGTDKRGVSAKIYDMPLTKKGT